PVEHPHLDPAVVAPLGRLIGTEPFFGQIAPASTRTGHPQQGVEEPPPVTARTALALATTRYKRFDPFPLIVAKNLSFHADLQKPAWNLICPLKRSPKP